MPSRIVTSWGNVVRAEHSLHRVHSRFDGFPDVDPESTVLPFGNGRSYGDSCLNIGGALLETCSLDRFIHFDREAGILACEAGVQLTDVLRLVVPAGWFPCVVPGTQFVTLGGAIANDIHGKNHHRAGTFGCHVRQLELLRSSGESLVCSAHEKAEWLSATIAGLGLTGLITWAEIALKRIAGPWMEVESIRCANIEEFFDLAAESDHDFEYTVAWIDCLASGRHVGRGVLQRANHASTAGSPGRAKKARIGIPFTPPLSLVNAATLRLFNGVHYRRHARHRRSIQHYQSFFFPLDRIRNWNRLYGPRGFYQYQCVIPAVTARESTRELLEAISASGLGSFLAVLKCFGGATSPGMLSFPLHGVTLALDFPNRSERLERLFEELDAIVASAGGRLYPAKDGRMPRELFRSGYSRREEFARFIDPRCSSSFWRRVGETT